MRAPKALMLGVTPEIALMEWPASTELLSVDLSADMIRHVWPSPEMTPEPRTIKCDWRNIPVADNSRELLIGDGCLNIFSHPEGVRGLFSSLRRVLDVGGLLILRIFCRPEKRETPEEVFADLEDGRIGNFHIYKWRLAMALHGSIGEGVVLKVIHETHNRRYPTPEAMRAFTGWPLEEIATIEAYRDARAVYTFPTPSEARTFFDSGFAISEVVVPDYEIGACCPIFAALRER